MAQPGEHVGRVHPVEARVAVVPVEVVPAEHPAQAVAVRPAPVVVAEQEVVAVDGHPGDPQVLQVAERGQAAEAWQAGGPSPQRAEVGATGGRAGQRGEAPRLVPLGPAQVGAGGLW